LFQLNAFNELRSRFVIGVLVDKKALDGELEDDLTELGDGVE
jgi:hypothetical protein